MNENLIAQLHTFLDPESIKVDAETLKIYGQDWTRVYEPNPSLVVFPKTIKQIQQLVQFANAQQLAIVPSGGRTGLSGGAVAAKSEIVISMEKMNQILGFDAIGKTVICQAGLVIENLQNFALQHELYYPIDLASRGSCQIGGNIATNAGGVHVIRYGPTREWVRGVKVVTGQGDILEFNRGLVKNATGYDLRHLFVGSEGTLGIIVEAIVQLVHLPPARSVILLALEHLENALLILNELEKKLTLTAFEFFSESALAYVIAHTSAQRPFTASSPYYLLIEFENPQDANLDKALKIFELGQQQGWILDGVISQNETQAKDLWKLRENITASLAPFVPFKNDLSINNSLIPNFLQALKELMDGNQYNLEIVLFGHLADGNLHLNILKPKSLSMEKFLEKCQDLNEHIVKLVRKFHGSISAEHGVGLLKKDYLKITKSAEEINLMRKIKKVFDPNGIMNPGKIFD